MVNTADIYRYFPGLSDTQKSQFEKLMPVYREWNEKINVISRKDIDELYLKHVLHSLSIVKLADMKNVHTVLDIGTGGGFPGIPLAIYFPEIEFHLVDSIGKKISVVNAVKEELGLKNVKAEQARAEQIKGKYDVVVCRAVTQLVDFYAWVHKNLKPDSELICLKGGDLTDEIYNFRKQYPRKRVEVKEISEVFGEEFFKTKKVLIVRGG